MEKEEKPIFYLYGEIPIFKKDCHPDFLEYKPCENSVRPDGTIYITEDFCINYEGEFEEDIY